MANWIDDIVWTYSSARAASEVMTEHAASRTWDKTGWPHHYVYSNCQAQGMLFASRWLEHETNIRVFVGALPADQYYPLKLDADKTITDPALRTKAHEIVERLRTCDRQIWDNIEGLSMPKAETVDEETIAEQTIAARIAVITDVRPHGENLSIVTVLGHEVVANRKEDGSFRWTKDEVCIYVPEGMIIPDDVLKERGYWDEEKDRGMLDGKKRNLVKMRRFAGHESRGLLLKVDLPESRNLLPKVNYENEKKHWIARGDQDLSVNIGDDVSSFLGITERVVA